MLREQPFRGNTAFSATSRAARLLASACLRRKTQVPAEGIRIARGEREGPGVRRSAGCSTTARGPHAVLPTAGLPGRRRRALELMSRAKPTLRCPASPFSCPLPVAQVLAGEELQSEGLPGVQWQILALWAGGAPLLPFQGD